MHRRQLPVGPAVMALGQPSLSNEVANRDGGRRQVRSVTGVCDRRRQLRRIMRFGKGK